MTGSLFAKLKQVVRGEVRDDLITRQIYSVDASIYEVEPLGVVQPLDKDDLLLTLQIAASYGVPVTARGAATGITGSCLGNGIIVDLSRYLNKVLEINIDQEYAIVEPGVVQDHLNELLTPSGYRLGPDTSTGNRATIGGMLANNSAGARSLYYGRMVDHVLEVELALSGGQIIHCAPLSAHQLSEKRKKDDHEGRIYREMHRILTRHESAIKTHFPKIPRHVSGYNLDYLVENSPFNLSKLITGSEGTLGIATSIKLKITKKPKVSGLCVLHIPEMIPALKAVEGMLKHHPLSLEMIDEKIIEAARHSPAVKGKLGWLQGNPEAVFIAEFQSDTQEEVEVKLKRFANDMKELNVGYALTFLTDPQKMSHVWDVRKAGLGLLLSKRSYSRAIAFIEDISVAPSKLHDFLKEFKAYLKRIGKDAGIYGHLGSGCMHIRPYIDLRQEHEVNLMQEMSEEVSSLVLAHGGAMSGEHGDGLVRSWLNEKMFGDEVYQAFRDVKAAFDPYQLMNPGKIVNGQPLTENMRLSPSTKQQHISTFLDFSAEGGFDLAVDLCNGNGQCRKKEGVMCPPFQVSGDEYHTTRARAQTLRGILHGKIPKEELTGQGLYDVLDLCIECKGCRKECPSQVNMAKMKSEFLYQYQEKHGYSMRSRLFGHLHSIDRLTYPFGRLYNASENLLKPILKQLGITSERPLPKIAQEKFSDWYKRQPKQKHERKVALFVDTYTEYHEPEIGKATYRLLDALQYHMIIIKGHCCGRPLISKGFLKQAKRYSEHIVDAFTPIWQRDIQIIVLEPSCLSAFEDDYFGLLNKEMQKSQLKSHCMSLETFLERSLVNGKLPLDVVERKQDVWVHTHCHQKALHGSDTTIQLLSSLPGWNVKEIQSGCCGMAGSFGYEEEHYQMSMRIGEHKLLPSVRQSSDGALIVANGFSCRTQILHGAGRCALHPAEALLTALHKS